MNPPDKIVLEHVGALGDFLLAWPALVAVARHFAGLPIHAALRSAHAPWLAPLATPCPPDIRRGLDARFSATTWPQALTGVLVVRPGLAKRPELPDSPYFWFLPGLIAGRWENPRVLYREALAARGIAWPIDPGGLFRRFFGGHVPNGRRVLLFPGAGHPDKAWPLGHLETLARRLAAHALEPIFVLGPAERERHVLPHDGQILYPDSIGELERAIRTARFVIGPDCGPMHLAGLLGVPGIALFGPTAPAQWGPEGLDILTADLPCSPCTALTADSFAPDCPRPLPCLTAITPDAVWNRVMRWLP